MVRRVDRGQGGDDPAPVQLTNPPPTIEVTILRRNVLQPDWVSGSHLERFAAIEPWARGRAVLDIGAASGNRRADWLHGSLARVSRRLVGLDIDESEVERLRVAGWDIRHADACDFALDESFDVVVAGEVIEHLDNLKGFLRSVARHLSPGGLLVITTPNPFAVSNFVYRLFDGVRVHHEHTAWYCETTLAQLLRRHGFEVEATDFVAHNTPGLVRSTLASALRRALPARLRWGTLLMVGAKSAGQQG